MASLGFVTEHRRCLPPNRLVCLPVPALRSSSIRLTLAASRPKCRCPELEGCFLGNEAFPYRGCQLIDLTGFLNTSINTGQLKQAGPDVPFLSGAPPPSAPLCTAAAPRRTLQPAADESALVPAIPGCCAAAGAAPPLVPEAQPRASAPICPPGCPPPPATAPQAPPSSSPSPS